MSTHPSQYWPKWVDVMRLAFLLSVASGIMLSMQVHTMLLLSLLTFPCDHKAAPGRMPRQSLGVALHATLFISARIACDVHVDV